MARHKARASITIPEDLLADLDRRAGEQGRTRSDMICEAVTAYFASEEERLLAEGYAEMAGESSGAASDFMSAAAEVWPGC